MGDQTFFQIAILATAVFAVWSSRHRVREQSDFPASRAANDEHSPLHQGGSANGRRVQVRDAETIVDLAARVVELEHKYKLLANEWADKESRIDSILKRVHRLRKLEEDRQEETPAPATPALSAQEQRALILRNHQQQQRG